MSNLFEKASKQKLRFETSKGHLSTEDLWDLSLPSLDKVAKGIHSQIKNSEEISFIKESSSANTELNLKMDIVKYIIDYKLHLKEAAQKRAEKEAHLAELKEIYKDKTKEEMKGLSKEDIAKRIAELES